MKYIKSWPTKKIKEILENPYGRSDIGTDFEEILTELRDEYYKRLNKQDEKETEELLAEMV